MTKQELGYIVEHQVTDIPVDEVRTYQDTLKLVAQASYELYESLIPTDDESPRTREYEAANHRVMTVSYDPQHVALYIDLPSGERMLYTYNQSEAHPLTVDTYDNPDSNEPTQTYAPLSIAENVPLLIDIYGYIRRATAS